MVKQRLMPQVNLKVAVKAIGHRLHICRIRYGWIRKGGVLGGENIARGNRPRGRVGTEAVVNPTFNARVGRCSCNQVTSLMMVNLAMSAYGKIACSAAEKARNGMSPQSAWENSARESYPEPGQIESRNKVCPRDAFLGLSEDGLIIGIPPGEYTRSIKSKKYAIAGVFLLREVPNLCENKSKMWRIVRDMWCVMGDEPTEKNKAANNRMDVVVALWQNGDIRHTA